MQKTAIILGATGLTGGLVLERLLEDERYEKIKLFSRSPSQVKHPKIEEHLGDLIQLKNFKSEFTADEVYCCIGTTASKTPDKEKYRQIDYGIPVAAASIAKENGIDTFLVMSSMGANPKSSVFYNRTKGEMEEAVLSEGIESLYVLRPALIGGQREEKRGGEYLAKVLFKLINPLLIGGLRKYRSIKPEYIAKAMIWLANHPYEQTVVESDALQQIATTQ